MSFYFADIRVKKRIKQKEFADLLGITPQYLSKIENGKVDIKLSMMLKISNLLNVPVQELFFNEE